MKKRDMRVEQFRDLTWFIHQFKHGFEYLAQVRGYTDEQHRQLEAVTRHGLQDLDTGSKSRPAGLDTVRAETQARRARVLQPLVEKPAQAPARGGLEGRLQIVPARGGESMPLPEKT